MPGLVQYINIVIKLNLGSDTPLSCNRFAGSSNRGSVPACRSLCFGGNGEVLEHNLKPLVWEKDWRAP